jgi:hypothetical protein
MYIPTMPQSSCFAIIPKQSRFRIAKLRERHGVLRLIRDIEQFVRIVREIKQFVVYAIIFVDMDVVYSSA